VIKLYKLLFESREVSTLEYLGKIIQNSPFAGKVFLAGGAVRDELMGKPVKDIDLVVAMPDGGIQFAKWITQKTGAYKEGANPVIFQRFGTAKFNLRGVEYNGIDLSGIDIECVMTRGEKYETGSRKPEVVYADLKVDAERRDLTVNSLFKDLVTGEIKDLTGKGINDINKGIVRTPLDPDVTFRDDPLRMLRAIRFAVKYNWRMPLSLIKALKKNAHMLKVISDERIQDEFNKILMTENPDKGLKLLVFTGLNKFIVPELYKTIGVTQNQYHKDDVFNHILEVVKKTPPDLKARLAALFHDIAKPETRTEDNTGIHFYGHEDVGEEVSKVAMRRLKYSNEMIHSVSLIVKNHMKLKFAGEDGSKASDKTLRRFMTVIGSDLGSALKMMHADNVSHSDDASMPEQIKRLASRMETLSSEQSNTNKPNLPINGNDIMSTLGIKPGPLLKQLKAHVEEAWYENPSLSADDAMNIVKREYEKISGSNTSDTDMMNQKIKNPETGNEILIKTALGYEKNHPAYIAAMRFLNK
jgi:poly(A) polymerase